MVAEVLVVDLDTLLEDHLIMQEGHADEATHSTARYGASSREVRTNVHTNDDDDDDDPRRPRGRKTVAESPSQAQGRTRKKLRVRSRPSNSVREAHTPVASDTNA